MNDILIENIKLKSDLQYDFLFESKEYHDLDSDNKTFLKECYDMGVNQAIYLHQQDKALLESIDEGLWDRFKAGAARVGQGLKNVSGIGTPTTDSKDAGVDSLLNSFKTKWAKAPKAQTSPAAGNNATNAVVSGVNNSLNQIAAASANSPTPPPTPAAAAQIINQSNAPVGLKTKIANLIRANPGKTKFLLGVLSFGAGVAAAAATGGNPLVGKAAGALINGIGNAAIAKIQGRGTGDAVMSGLGGALAGASLASLGAGATNLLGAAAEQGVDAAMGTDGSALPVTKTPTPFPGTRPEDIVPGSANDPNQGMYQGNPASAGPGNWQSGAIAPEDQRLPDTEAPDTNQYDAKGNRIYPQQGFADTSDANSPEVQVTQQQSAVSPEDLSTGETEPDTFADTSDANSPEVQATQQQVANTPQGSPQSRFRSALDPRSARVAFDRSRGVIKEEKMFVKSYNNTYTIRKSLNENIEEKWNESVEETLDEALSPEQTKIYNEFLADLGKMFKKPPGEVIAFMQSQGDRFKNVLDYINQNVTPMGAGGGVAAPGAVPPVLPGQPGAQPTGSESNFKMDANQLKNVKIFLSKLIELGNVLNKTNVQNLDKATLKNLAISSLSIGDILVNKNGAGKSNVALDKVLQGIDILGPLPPPKARQASTTGPVSSVFKEDVGGYKNPALTKQITALKDNPLFKGLQQRLINLLGFAKFDSRTGASVNNLDNRESIIALRKVLSDVNNVMIKFSPQVSQKLGGNPAAIKKELEADKGFVKEVASEQQRVKFITELNAAMPLIIGLMSSLRQTFNRKNPNNIYKQDIKPSQPTTDNKPSDNKSSDNKLAVTKPNKSSGEINVTSPKNSGTKSPRRTGELGSGKVTDV